MKLNKNASGKVMLKLTVEEWFRIGKIAGWANQIQHQGLRLQWVDHGDTVSYQADFQGKTQMSSVPKADFMQRFGEQIKAANATDTQQSQQMQPPQVQQQGQPPFVQPQGT